MRHPLRTGFLLCFALLVAVGSGCAVSRLERNKQIVLAQARAYNERDIDAFRATVAPDLRRHCQATPDIDVRSADDFVAFAESDWRSFPDGRLEVNRLVAEGDLVGVFGRYTGTQEGPMGPFPASGERVALDFAGVFRIAADRIAEIWITWDNLAALTQLGHWPPGVAPEAGDQRESLGGGPLPTPADGSGVVYVQSDTLLPCHVRAPEDFRPDHTYDLLIGLHGFGDRADAFARLSAPFVDAGMLFAAPQAPTAFLAGDRIGYDWDRAHVGDADPGVRTAFGQTSAEYITDVIRDLKDRYHVRRVYLLGFSQGGAFAYVVGIHRPEVVSGIIVVGMGFETEWFRKGALEAGTRLPVLVMHSPDDRRVPLAYASASAEQLVDLGYDVTVLEYEGGHRVTDEVLERALMWLRDR